MNRLSIEERAKILGCLVATTFGVWRRLQSFRIKNRP